mmetsp:Transcript_11753/g.33229  ORF Transcript_11753/g.33229 Transcript_11753/m.33229 type:complete len:494 (+) Transcript_11753:428-1909(+)
MQQVGYWRGFLSTDSRCKMWRGTTCQRPCTSVVPLAAAGTSSASCGGGSGKSRKRGRDSVLPEVRPAQQQRDQPLARGVPNRRDDAAGKCRRRSAPSPRRKETLRPWEANDPRACSDSGPRRPGPSTSPSRPSKPRDIPPHPHDKEAKRKDKGQNHTTRLRPSQSIPGRIIAVPPQAPSKKTKEKASQPSTGLPALCPSSFVMTSVEDQSYFNSGYYLSESLRAQERKIYKAAGVLFYSFLEDGRLVLLLATRERSVGVQADSRKGRAASLWSFLGGKRERIDQSPEETALREAHEESAGQLRVKPQFSLVAWLPHARYVLFISHLPGHMDVPLVFSLMRGQGITCWGGTQTEQLQWVPLDDIYVLHFYNPTYSRISWIAWQALRHCKPLLSWLRHQQKNQQERLQGSLGKNSLSREVAQLENPRRASAARIGPSLGDLEPAVHTAVVRPWLLDPLEEEGHRLSCWPAGLPLRKIPMSLLYRRPAYAASTCSR